MADTTFTGNGHSLPTDWLNDVNDFVYAGGGGVDFGSQSLDNVVRRMDWGTPANRDVADIVTAGIHDYQFANGNMRAELLGDPTLRGATTSTQDGIQFNFYSGTQATPQSITLETQALSSTNPSLAPTAKVLEFGLRQNAYTPQAGDFDIGLRIADVLGPFAVIIRIDATSPTYLFRANNGGIEIDTGITRVNLEYTRWRLVYDRANSIAACYHMNNSTGVWSLVATTSSFTSIPNIDNSNRVKFFANQVRTNNGNGSLVWIGPEISFMEIGS